MSKYDGLGVYLREQSKAEVPMTFSEIEKVTGTPLPPKAAQQRAWWSNNPNNNVMTKIWLAAGYETAQVDLAGRKLVFKRIVQTAKGPGMADEAREFRTENTGEKKPRRHPAFGAMKGTFWIDPNWDLTKPTMDEDELAEWDASLDRKADRIDAGLRRKP